MVLKYPHIAFSWLCPAEGENVLQSSTSVIPIRPRVLITGGAGYIGSILARRLLAEGYQVRVLDALFYGAGSLSGLEKNPWFELIVGDTRDPGAVDEALTDVDSVVHLAELVGDPACAVDPIVTRQINIDATRNIVQRAIDLGVRRFVYPSSCSVYGASDHVVDEQSAPNPVSLYAEAKVLAEEAVALASNDGLETVTLRLATVYGLSPRPRFDLVVNLFAARGAAERRIAVHGGGQWRPFIHVADVAEVMVAALEADARSVAGRTFNVGADDQNHTIGEIATMVHQHVPDAEMHVEAIDDHRNYRVSFERMNRTFGFRPTRTLDDGIIEIQSAIAGGRIRDYRDSRYSNVQTLRAGLPFVARARVAVPVEVSSRAPVGDAEAQLAG